MCRLYNNGVNIYDSVCAYKMDPCMQIVSYHFYLEEQLVNKIKTAVFALIIVFFCALKVLIESCHCFFAVEWRLRAAVLLLFVMSLWSLWSDSEIAQKTRSAVIVPCLLLIVSLRPVLLFYLYFSFKHSAIIFLFYLNRNLSLRSSFMQAFMSPCPLNDVLFPHFLAASLSLSCDFSVLLKCTFRGRDHSLTVILMGNIQSFPTNMAASLT